MASDLRDHLRLAARGDWRTRALALSAAGQIAGAEAPWRRSLLWLTRRVPGWRTRFVGAAYARGVIENGVADRSWAVRTAAAFALGECPHWKSRDALRAQLRALYRAERVAAAVALIRCGQPPGPANGILDGALPVPSRIGDAAASADFLTLLASRHLSQLAGWLTLEGSDRPDDESPASWARWLAGQAPARDYAGPHAEIERYDESGETAYLLAKPFTPINRAQNVRHLQTFAAIAEHLRAPVGARILDLGGGSAWVSELLTKLGYQAYTIDVSHALLSVGRRRFAREGLTPRFVAGDMTRLPVASGSMTAAVVSDALHHVPDVPAVFRETFRVLADGGQFIMSEPGEGHAETAKSRGEIQEYGVEEREIHLLEAVEYGRAAGFTDTRIVPKMRPILHLSPDDLAEAVRTPADSWRMRLDDGRPVAFPAFVLQSLFDHPVIVFHKGRRSIDSRVPQRLLAEIQPRLQRRGRRVTGVVSLRNRGDTRWLHGRTDTGAVLLGVHLLSPERQIVQLDWYRVSLRADVPPGETADVAIDCELPDELRPFCLKLDLVAEGVCWFEDAGSEPVYVDV